MSGSRPAGPHDWNMPHDVRYGDDTTDGCPPNCPARQEPVCSRCGGPRQVNAECPACPPLPDPVPNLVRAAPAPVVAYDRQVLVEVLVYHYRRDITSCGCGWAELGRSWPEHVAAVYEESVAARSEAAPGA